MIARRPLTMLLLAATLCVDVVVYAANYGQRNAHISMLGMALFFAQIGLLSLWLVLGRGGWWIRFLIWIAAVSLIGSIYAWPDAATGFVIVAAVACSVCLLTMFANGLGLIGSVTGAQSRMREEPWQFSLVHALVWTTLVAVMAAALRFSELPELRSDWASLGAIAIVFASLSVIPVIAAVLLKGRQAAWLRMAYLLGFAGGISLMVAIAVQDLMLVYVYLVQACFTGVWIVVVDYDVAHAQRRGAATDAQ